jgi:hypothetical protein
MSAVRIIYHLYFPRLSTQRVSQTAVPPSPMAALRQPQVIVPWSVLEIAPSFVVVQVALLCTTIPVPTFHLGIEAAAMSRQFSPSFPISKWDGHTTPAGCKLPLLACLMQNI